VVWFAVLRRGLALGGFRGVGVLGLLGLDGGAVPRGPATAERRPLGPLVLPAFALLLLVLPYLPVLADVFPALQVLAGPARYVVWLVVGSQLLWVIWQRRLVNVDWLRRFSLPQLAVGAGAATALITGAVAIRLMDSPVYPGGDEPHYLVIAQSLWRDGDLKIENNHDRGDYYEYFSQQLDPHYLTRGSDGEIYSIHPVGMPVLITPIYGIGGYPAVLVFFIAMASCAAGVMWYATTRITNAPGAATFAWASVVATAPFLFNSFAVYPEIPAALAVAIAFNGIAVSTSSRVRRWVGVGVACAVLPWLSTKYAPMSAALVAVGLGRILFPGATGAMSAAGAGAADAGAPGAGTPGAPRAGALAALKAQPGNALAVVIPYALSLAAWFYFFYAFWGVPLPQAPYGALVQTSVRYLTFGAPGLLFDQEYGLLPYAPVYILAATGLWHMVRLDAESRRRAVEIIIVFAALVGTVGAFRIWWGGSAAPGRPVTSGLLLLAVPMAVAFREAAAGSAQRAAQHLLLWASIGLAGVVALAQQGLLLANDRDGTSMLLEYLSPRWPAWTVPPSFIYHEAPTAWFHSLLWLALAGVSAWAIRQIRLALPGAASLAALLLTAASLLVAALVMPRLPLLPAWPSIDVRARPRLPLLDEFDTIARPIAIEYTPMDVTPPGAVLTRASVMVEPQSRRPPQPIRVLHNGRFSLPAGTYRIEVEWSGTRPSETLALQIGRTGDPMMTWQVEAEANTVWTTEITIPVDAPFVGLRGTRDLERVIRRIHLVPLSIVNASERLRGPAVIAASQSGPASLFYYDLNAAPEGNGFWVLGARTTRVTIARPSSAAPLTLRVHSGPIANRLQVSTFGSTNTTTLEPDAPVDVEVPVKDDVITLELRTDSAFVPAELDAAATDDRALGVWVEVIK
jgi:hypothetical protein